MPIDYVDQAMQSLDDMKGPKTVMKFIKYGVLFLILLIIGLGSVTIVPEGHEAVITRFAKANRSLEPGLHLKIPLIEGRKLFDMRERKITETLDAATENRLPVTAQTSVNWRLKAGKSIDVYRNYGTMEAFEQNILVPRLRQAAKAGISKFGPDALIKERNLVADKIEQFLQEALAGYPVVISHVQLENIQLPKEYMLAVQRKLQAFEDAQRERYNLQRQKLEAQRKVQTAEAERDAAKARADGLAYATVTKAKAEAEAIKMRGQAEAAAVKAVQEAIAQNPLIIDYERAKRWDGKLPKTYIGGKDGMLFMLPGGEK